MLATRRMVMYKLQYRLRDGGYRCSPTLSSTLSYAFTLTRQYSEYNTALAIAGLSRSSLALLRCILRRCLSVTLVRRCHSFHSLALVVHSMRVSRFLITTRPIVRGRTWDLFLNLTKLTRVNLKDSGFYRLTNGDTISNLGFPDKDYRRRVNAIARSRSDRTSCSGVYLSWGLNCLRKLIQRSHDRWWASRDNSCRFGTFPAYLVEA